MYRYLFILLLFFWSFGKGNSIVDNNDNENTVSTSSLKSIDTKTVENYIFYIGTYTDSGSKGIYKSTFHADSGKITAPELVATILNPSFQCISNDHKFLWSVGESDTGSVFGFLIDTVTGNLQKKATFSSLGSGPCFVDFDSKTMNVITANYNSGNVTNIPVTANGTAKGKSFTHQHTGTGPNASRQEVPHAHCSKFDPTGKYIYSCDLGADKIYVYTIKGDSLIVYKTITIAAGSGPRHIDFHPQQKSLVVINELAGTVTTFLPDGNGCFSVYLSTISTLPDDFKSENKCADIHFSPDGKYLYASNRGHNSISIFHINPSTFAPELIGWQTSNIKTPRNFAIDPTGNYLLVANQDGDRIVVFKINHSTGELTDTGFYTTLSKPVCITFLNIAK